MRIEYEKMDENYAIIIAPKNDLDGEITGKSILNLHAWFEENPDERIRLGWTKHICRSPEELNIAYNHQSQYLVKSTTQIDDYTLDDTYHVLDKSEEMMALEELMSESILRSGGIFITTGF